MRAVEWLGAVPPIDCGSAEARDQLAKAQSIRLLDVFAIGPLMVYGAAKMPAGPAALLLGFFVVTTVVYNGVNYLRLRGVHDACG